MDDRDSSTAPPTALQKLGQSMHAAWANIDGSSTAARRERERIGQLISAERKRLDGLTPDTMNDDVLFAETRRIGNRFQDGLSGLFFATHSRLTEAAQRYGVF